MKRGDTRNLSPVLRPSPLPNLASGAHRLQWWIVCGNLQVRRSASILMSPFWPILAQTFEFCPRESSRGLCCLLSYSAKSS